MQMMIVEKKNPLAVHAYCSSEESAAKWLAVNAVDYCKRGLFMDKTLTSDCFEAKVRA